MPEITRLDLQRVRLADKIGQGKVAATELISAREGATTATRAIVRLAEEIGHYHLPQAVGDHQRAAASASALGFKMDDAVAAAELATLDAAQALVAAVEAHRDLLLPPAGWRERDSDLDRALVALGL